MALTDDLVSYWKLDEASGNATDSHGTNALTNVSAGSVPGKVGNARDFDTGTYLFIGDNASLSVGSTDFAIAFWVRFDSLSGLKFVLRKGEEFYIYHNGASLVFEALTTGGYAVRTIGTVTTGTWFFVVIWWDNTNGSMCSSLNANAAATTSLGSTFRDHNGSFVIGNSFNGSVDEMGFWKRVLTSDERTQLYNGGNGLAYPFTAASASRLLLLRRRAAMGVM